ncbi:MAG: DNA translocase FtsK, partial [Thermoguttaceae bacterium]
RAARLVDFMAEDGIVGNYNGSQAREVLITLEQWAEMMGGGQSGPDKPSASAAVEPPQRPGGEILLSSPERRSPRVPVAGLSLADVESGEERPAVNRRNRDEDLEEEDAYDEEEDEEENVEGDEQDDEEEDDDEMEVESDEFVEVPFEDEADDGDLTAENDDAEAYDEEEEYPVSAFQQEEEEGPEDTPHRSSKPPRRRTGSG